MPNLPYEQPGITTILSLASFLLLLNAIRYALDRLLYCGIVGEILIGIIWGLPVGGTAWLSLQTQETIQTLGYLGLIGLVFEGGLSTDIALLRKNACLSISVAIVGVLMPIALSFLLLVVPFSSNNRTAYPTPLAAFSAGASLCSTSLGTTFAILSSVSLQKTRVGIVLVGAAMMDDVIGLVMVNIVTTLGRGGTVGWPIAQPIVASFGLLLVTISTCVFVLRPIWRWLLGILHRDVQLNALANSESTLTNTVAKFINDTPQLNLILSTLVLLAFVTIASFIDASVLFATFTAGNVVSFLWTEPQPAQLNSDNGPTKMYVVHYKPAMDFILLPFFFASIGFSIPIRSMFTRAIVWKGLVYSILMIIAKGLVSTVIYFEYFLENLKRNRSQITRRAQETPPCSNNEQIRMGSPSATTPNHDSSPQDVELSKPPHSKALLVGLSMVSRGEIGFLIASLSQSSGTLTLRYQNGSSAESSNEQIFLVIVWAVVICTLVGPLGVGITVTRLRH